MKNSKLYGAATKINIYVDENRQIEFRIALVELENNPMFGEREPKLELRMVSQDGISTKSFYSGGITGTGIGEYTLNELLNPRAEDSGYEEEIKRIITYSLPAILSWEEAEAQLKEEREKNRDEDMQRRVERINQLPTEYKIEQFPEFIIRRTQAVYNSHHSLSIQGGYAHLKMKEGREWEIFPTYKTKGGSLQIKRFRLDMGRYFKGERATKLDAKETLRILYKELEGIQDTLKRIKLEKGGKI